MSYYCIIIIKLHENQYEYPSTIEFGVPALQIITKSKQIINDEITNNFHNTIAITTTSNNNKNAKHHLLFYEIACASSMLEYAHCRLSSNLIKVLNLHFGHNNYFLSNEKNEL